MDCVAWPPSVALNLYAVSNFAITLRVVRECLNTTDNNVSALMLRGGLHKPDFNYVLWSPLLSASYLEIQRPFLTLTLQYRVTPILSGSREMRLHLNCTTEEICELIRRGYISRIEGVMLHTAVDTGLNIWPYM